MEGGFKGGIAFFHVRCVRLPVVTQRGINPYSYEDSRRVVGRLSGTIAHSYRAAALPDNRPTENKRLTNNLLKHNTLDPFLISVVSLDSHNREKKRVVLVVGAGNLPLYLPLRLLTCSKNTYECL